MNKLMLVGLSVVVVGCVYLVQQQAKENAKLWQEVNTLKRLHKPVTQVKEFK